jgi:hypothetical protein
MNNHQVIIQAVSLLAFSSTAGGMHAGSKKQLPNKEKASP